MIVFRHDMKVIPHRSSYRENKAQLYAIHVCPKLSLSLLKIGKINNSVVCNLIYEMVHTIMGIEFICLK